MEANKAPEKIYLFENPITEVPDDRWLSKRSDKNDIEYVRKDAFIEKAVKWLMDNIQDYTDDGMGEHSFVLVQDLKEHFKKYMEE